MKETAVVTGAAGFIGSYLVKELIEHDYKVIAVSREWHNTTFPISPLLTLVNADLRTPVANLLRCVSSADIWFHFAWSGHTGANRVNVPLQMTNVEMAVNCVKTAKLLGCRRFVNAESLMVDELTYFFESGHTPPAGHIYGVAKQSANEMVRIVANDIGIEYVGGKISTYGVNEKSDRLINRVLKNIINNQPVCLTKGEQNYDFAYVTDVARAFRLISEKGKASKEYFIGSGHAKPLKEFMLEIKRITGNCARLQFGAITLNSAMLPIETFDISELSKDCNYFPEVSFDEGIKRCYDYYRLEADKC